jgi:hypothetical protein
MNQAMFRRTMLVLMSASLISGMGCAMCCGPDMYTYPTHGGRVQRSDLEYGRVGSIYTDPRADTGAYAELSPSMESPSSQPSPTPLEQLETTRSAPSQAPQKDNARRPRTNDSWR